MASIEDDKVVCLWLMRLEKKAIEPRNSSKDPIKCYLSASRSHKVYAMQNSLIFPYLRISSNRKRIEMKIKTRIHLP